MGIQVFTKDNKKPQNIKLDGKKGPFSLSFLYHFITAGKTCTPLRYVDRAMRDGTTRKVIFPTENEKVNFREKAEVFSKKRVWDNPSEYARHKELTPLVAFTGVPHRLANLDSWEHSCRINIDIDGRDEWAVPDDIKQILRGCPYFEFFARSASGVRYGCNNGWANFRIQWPTDEEITGEDRRMLGLGFAPLTTVEIHNVFRDAILLELRHGYGLEGAGHGDAKRLRYLIYDPGAVWVENCQPLSWSQAREIYTRYAAMESRTAAGNKAYRARPEAIHEGVKPFLIEKTKEALSRNLNHDDPDYVEGMRHHFAYTFGMVACCHGIDLDTALGWFEEDFLSRLSYTAERHEFKDGPRSIRDAYRKYADQFGMYADALAPPEIRTLHLGPNQYLSQVATAEDLTDVCLIAPTGSGKTKAVMDLLPGRCVILTPLTSLVKSVLTRPGSEFIPVWSDDENATGIDWRNPPEKIVCVFASSRKLIGELLREDLLGAYHLIIDEAHYLATATSPGFMLSDLRFMWQHRKLFRHQTLMTGTPVYLHGLDIPTLEVTTTTRRRKTYRLVQFRKMHHRRTTDGVAGYIRNLIEGAEDAPVLVWQNDKTRLRVILEGLLQDLISTDVIACVTSHTKKERPEWFSQLVTSGRFPQPCRAIITTSAIQEGIDFDDYTGEAHVVISGFPSVEEIQQFSERFRRASAIHIHHLQTERELPNSGEAEDIDAHAYAMWREHTTRHTLNTIRSKVRAAKYEDTLRAMRAYGNRIHAYYDPDDGLKVDALSINNEIFERTKAHRNKHYTLFLNTLEKYHIEILSPLMLDPPARTTDQQAMIDEIKDEMDFARNNAFEGTTEALFNARKNIVDAALRYTRLRNYQLAMGEEDAVVSIHDFMQHIVRDKEVFLTLMPEEDRFNKSHQRAVGSRLYAEWLMLQPNIPNPIKDAYNRLSAIPDGVYTERQVQLFAADALRVLENLGANFPPFTIAYSRRVLRPFIKTYKNLDEYRLEKFVLPFNLRYIAEAELTH